MNQVEAQLAQVQESIDTIGNKLYRNEPSLSDILKAQSFKIGTVRAVLWPTAPQNTNVEKSNSIQQAKPKIISDAVELLSKALGELSSYEDAPRDVIGYVEDAWSLLKGK